MKRTFVIVKSSRATRWLLLAITGVAFLFRAANLAGQSLWRDEIDVIRLSGQDLSTLVSNMVLAGHNGPLYIFLLRPWRWLAGNSEFAVRYPALMAGVLAVPLGYSLARRLNFSRQTGLLLSLFLATSPYLVWYGQEAKMYTMLMVLVTLAMIAYLQALRYGRAAAWLSFSLATTLSFYTHILAPLMLIVYLLVALLHPTNLRRHWRGWLASMASLTLPYLPLAWWQFSMLREGYSTGHSFYPLQQEIQVLLQLYASGLVRFVGMPLVMLNIFLLLCGLFLGRPGENTFVLWRDRPEPAQWRRRLILALWVSLPPLAVYLISLRVPVFEDRYLIYITPAFYLLVATGLTRLKAHARWPAALLLGLLVAINVAGIGHQQYRPIKADFRAVAAYLAAQPDPPSPIMVQIPYLINTLQYYYPQNARFVEGLWTNDGKSEAVVDAEMNSLTAEMADLWLVVSEEEMWDSRRLTRAWLDEHAYLISKASFARVDVYHYQLRPGTLTTPLNPP